MSQTVSTIPPEFLWYGAISLLVALVVHVFVRRFWYAVSISAFVPSFVNVAYELVEHNFSIRPSDLAFWLPMMLVNGALIALPFAAIAGVPFAIAHRRKLALTG